MKAVATYTGLLIAVVTGLCGLQGNSEWSSGPPLPLAGCHRTGPSGPVVCETACTVVKAAVDFFSLFFLHGG